MRDTVLRRYGTIRPTAMKSRATIRSRAIVKSAEFDSCAQPIQKFQESARILHKNPKTENINDCDNGINCQE
jgi:hypothetical protein